MGGRTEEEGTLGTRRLEQQGLSCIERRGKEEEMIKLSS